MKANELRIGDFVEIDQYPNDRVIIQIENGSNIDQCGKLNASPIPLTEEWLLRFGFENWDKNAWANKISLHKQGEVFLYKAVYQSDYVEIKYVHQLQNLYFALTGEELTYGGGEQ
jgi:hypothetical protein